MKPAHRVIRGTIPFDFKLEDYYWKPTRAELKSQQQEVIRRTRLEWANAEKLKFDATIDRILKLRAKSLETSVAEDRAWLKYEAEREARQAERDRQVEQIRNWYETEHKKELDAQDTARRNKAKKLLEEINADTCRSERDALARRGAIRGRRSAT